jgi:hypothetical protein
VDAENHGDHMVELLKQNPYSYNKDNFLNARNIDFYAPKFAGGDSSQYIITVQYKEAKSITLDEAKIWIERGTYAITRMELEKFPNPLYAKSHYDVIRHWTWKLVNEKDIIETRKFNGKYMVSALRRVYNHHVLNAQTGAVDFLVEENFDLFLDDYDTDEVTAKIKKQNFSESTELYHSKYNYDEKFWNKYDALDDYPLQADIKKDLEHAKPLEQQFKDAGK